MTYVVLFFVGCAVIVLAAGVLVIMMESELEYVDRSEDPLQSEWDAAEVIQASRPLPLLPNKES